MRVIRLALAALFAVLAFGAMSAASASAFHPLFLTQSGKELLFSGEGGLAILRAVHLVLGTIDCEKSLTDGFALNGSTLAHRVVVEFHGKCLLTAGSTVAKCNEPIKTKPMLAELGLASSSLHKVLLLLAPSDGTAVFTQVVCGSNTTTVEGAIVGEIPEKNALGEAQIDVARSAIETVFESENKNENQKYTEIWLLGTQMTGAKLEVKEFFGGNASEEAKATLKGDGLITICTH